MSHAASLRVWKYCQARGAARCLMLAIADVADERGIAYPGVDYLAEMINEKPEYTDTLIKGRIEAGELYKIAGRGRGHKTRFAVLVGLSPKQQEALKGVLENPFSNGSKKGKPSAPFPSEKGDSNRPIAKGLLQTPKRVTLSDSNNEPFTGSESEQNDHAPIPDPMIHGVGGGGEPPAQNFAPAAAEQPAPPPADESEQLRRLFASYGIIEYERLAALYRQRWPDTTPDQVAELCRLKYNPKAGDQAAGRLYRLLQAGPVAPAGGAERERAAPAANRPCRSAARASQELDDDAIRAGVNLARRDW